MVGQRVCKYYGDGTFLIAVCRLEPVTHQNLSPTWVVFESRAPFIRVPHYIGDLKRDPNFENFPHKTVSLHPRALRP